MQLSLPFSTGQHPNSPRWWIQHFYFHCDWYWHLVHECVESDLDVGKTGIWYNKQDSIQEWCKDLRYDGSLQRSFADVIEQQEYSIVYKKRHLPVPLDRKQSLSFTRLRFASTGYSGFQHLNRLMNLLASVLVVYWVLIVCEVAEAFTSGYIT